MIPNIVHYIFGCKEQTEEFLFAYYLSVYSCFIVNKPDTIYFYYHFKPYGGWWDKLQEIECIELVQIDIPKQIGGKTIIKTAHKADKIRMDVLYEKGGVYLDIDTVCVRPYNHLLSNDVVLGKEVPDGICNAIMMTIKKSQFFRLWLDKYAQYFDPNGWREASVILPEIIAIDNPKLLTLQEADVFFLPNYTEVGKIFKTPYDIPNNLIALHLWESRSVNYIRNIHSWDWAYKNSHTLYGKIMLKLIYKYKVPMV